MLFLPEKCLRGRDDCKPYAQIESDGGVSFYCCGKNDGSNVAVKQDRFTFCFKGQHRDDMSFNDKRDLTHNASVLIQALAVIENDDCAEYHKEMT